MKRLLFAGGLSVLMILIAAGPTTSNTPGTILRTFQTSADGEKIRLGHCELSPDGSKLSIQLTDAEKESAKFSFYDVGTGRVLYEASGSDDGFWLAAFSPESSKVAFVRPREIDSSTVEVVDLAAGRVIYSSIAAPAIANGGVLFTPDGRHVIYGAKNIDPEADSGKSVYAIADVVTGTVVSQLKFGRFDGPRQISGDGLLMLSQTLEVWDMKTAARNCTLQKERQYQPIATCFIEDGKSVRALDADFTVRTWDARTGELISRIQPQKRSTLGPPANLNRDGSVFFRKDIASVFAFDAKSAEPIGFWRPGPFIHEDSQPETGFLVVRVDGLEGNNVAVMRMPPLTEFSPVQPPSNPRAGN